MNNRFLSYKDETLQKYSTIKVVKKHRFKTTSRQGQNVY